MPDRIGSSVRIQILGSNRVLTGTLTRLIHNYAEVIVMNSFRLIFKYPCGTQILSKVHGKFPLKAPNCKVLSWHIDARQPFAPVPRRENVST